MTDHNPHRPTPPCDCEACRAATKAADVRRAEIAAALAAETAEVSNGA